MIATEIPLGRLGTKHDIAMAAVFLSSGGAGFISYVCQPAPALIVRGGRETLCARDERVWKRLTMAMAMAMGRWRAGETRWWWTVARGCTAHHQYRARWCRSFRARSRIAAGTSEERLPPWHRRPTASWPSCESRSATDINTRGNAACAHQSWGRRGEGVRGLWAPRGERSDSSSCAPAVSRGELSRYSIRRRVFGPQEQRPTSSYLSQPLAIPLPAAQEPRAQEPSSERAAVFRAGVSGARRQNTKSLRDDSRGELWSDATAAVGIIFGFLLAARDHFVGGGAAEGERERERAA